MGKSNCGEGLATRSHLRSNRYSEVTRSRHPPGGSPIGSYSSGLIALQGNEAMWCQSHQDSFGICKFQGSQVSKTGRYHS